MRESEVAQSCPTLCDPKNCSPPGSSVHGIFQARVLEWGATAFSIISFYLGFIRKCWGMVALEWRLYAILQLELVCEKKRKRKQIRLIKVHYVEAFVLLHQGLKKRKGTRLKICCFKHELLTLLWLLGQYLHPFHHLQFLFSPSSQHWGSGSGQTHPPCKEQWDNPVRSWGTETWSGITI